VVEWLSEPYSLQVDTDGMAGVIGTGKIMANAIYYNRVPSPPYWYTKSEEKTVVKVRHVLKSELDVKEVSAMNPLPWGCNRMEATWQKAVMVNILNHEVIMEEAEKRNRLEYNNSNEEEESKDKASESELESDGYKLH
jgi:hypothetical protein